MLHKIALLWHDPKIGSHLEFTGLTRHQSVSHLTQARKDPHAAIAIRNISGPDWRVNFNARQPVYAPIADGRRCDVGLARNIGRHGFPIDRPEQKKSQHRHIQTDFFQKLCRADHLSNRKHIFFAFAISLAPVAIVLVAVATVPIISVILSALFLGERASLRSWGIILTVMLGIVISVYGDLRDDIDFNMQTVLGALLGLAVAFSLAINFIVVRQDRTVEFELALGIGALIAGLTAFALSSTATNVTLSSAFIISLTGLIILPVSFVMLSRASRYTTASNVSMLMLLETVLGPLWVWMVIDERPSHLTIAGGAIVILAIFYFLLSERKNSTPV